MDQNESRCRKMPHCQLLYEEHIFSRANSFYISIMSISSIFLMQWKHYCWDWFSRPSPICIWRRWIQGCIFVRSVQCTISDIFTALLYQYFFSAMILAILKLKKFIKRLFINCDEMQSRKKEDKKVVIVMNSSCCRPCGHLNYLCM